MVETLIFESPLQEEPEPSPIAENPTPFPADFDQTEWVFFHVNHLVKVIVGIVKELNGRICLCLVAFIEIGSED